MPVRTKEDDGLAVSTGGGVGGGSRSLKDLRTAVLASQLRAHFASIHQKHNFEHRLRCALGPA